MKQMGDTSPEDGYKPSIDLLKIEQDRFLYVSRATRDAVYDIDFESGLVWRNDGYHHLFGDILDDENQIDWWHDRIHPEDRQRVIKSSTDAKNKNRVFWTDEYRLQKYNGTYAYVIDRAYFIRNAKGVAKRKIGAISDITDRKQAELELQESVNRYRGFFEKNPVPMWVYDIDTLDFVDINTAAIQHYGYSREDFLSMKITQIRAHNDVHPVLKDLSSADSDLRSFFWRHIKKDGTIIDVELKSQPIRIADGQRTRLVAIYDITARKLAEQQVRTSLHEKEILLKEVHHRVKNNLAIIYSLLSLQADQFDDEVLRDPLVESMNRIRTMSLIHEKLYQSESLAKINLKSYIHDLVAGLKSSMSNNEDDIAVDITADDVILDVTLAVPCGLIINEILTNSIKHAFRGREDRSISIAIREEYSDYHIIISDNGKGLPEDFNPKNANTLGMTLIFGLSDQINASVKVTSNKGTSFSIEIPKHDATQ